ncbi:MAG: GWxTD domain-containing protein [Candidatus Aminicenantes bacterium]|nr:GWxTD domain-containing protein [Candidatus Aminicenantes bacterium]
MNNGKNRRILFAMGAIFLTVLSLPVRGVSAIPKKDVWYTQHYIIMQDFERKVYRKLSVNGRTAFQELFWAARTSDARAIFQARLEYVKKIFWKENNQQPWNTDRSRLYLLNGSPAAIDYDQNANWASTAALTGMGGAVATDRSNEDVAANRAEIWTYSYSRFFIKYGFVFVAPNSWRSSTPPAAGTQYRGQFEDFSRNVTFGIVELEKYKQDLAGLNKKK